MTRTHASLLTLILGSVLALPAANAQSKAPAAADAPMERALAKAQDGPDELRRFVARTAPIYMLDWKRIGRHLEARRQAHESAALAVATQDATARAPAK